MQSGSIVKVDIVCNGCFGLLFGVEIDVMQTFSFERMEKALCYSVVIAVAFAAHALDHTVDCQLIFE